MTATYQELIAHEAAPLSTTEQAAFIDHEHTIERGLDTFIAVGEALGQIRDGRLYRATHTTFADYLAERWPDIGGRRQADRLISAAEVERDLRPIGLSVANEAQARELAPLAPDERRKVMQRAVEASPDGKPTAAAIKRAAETFLPEPPTGWTWQRSGGYLSLKAPDGWTTRIDDDPAVVLGHARTYLVEQLPPQWRFVEEGGAWYAESLSGATTNMCDDKATAAGDAWLLALTAVATDVGATVQAAPSEPWERRWQIFRPGGVRDLLGSRAALATLQSVHNERLSTTEDLPPGWTFRQLGAGRWTAYRTADSLTTKEFRGRSGAAGDAWQLELTGLAEGVGARVRWLPTSSGEQRWEIAWNDGQSERLGQQAVFDRLQAAQPKPASPPEPMFSLAALQPVFFRLNTTINTETTHPLARSVAIDVLKLITPNPRERACLAFDLLASALHRVPMPQDEDGSVSEALAMLAEADDRELARNGSQYILRLLAAWLEIEPEEL